MLVLSRKVGETIHLGADIVIEVVRISEHAVKIGITAPASVSVHRSEVLMRIREEMAASENQEESESC